jgi:hypothetical protein
MIGQAQKNTPVPEAPILPPTSPAPIEWATKTATPRSESACSRRWMYWILRQSAL